ncbi:methionine adenosyltransferase 2 subunit beta [Verticillium alfalfae VaMs.102]|uniref:Methionine adenosyltransferase 2 subunit beta n=1 Tax=Verticillium alfalfae (strain VaMs.102 / ATCC MYA-4576 / FGSC 10136) TaxID=526221 RepID=C9S542_VERA1|nr:methionine adenosyltransferase 2 subunit beta [Verticillium alfalfae VaMs.102]EEY14142.1 methionine adenosyltransferase 2 subunit beta [Verticillium alfalfae VaMs.102]
MGSRTALVTGATGLLGRQVVKAFEKREWNVKGTGFSRADNVSVFKVDLGDAVELQKVIDDTSPRVVVHCAAQRFPDKVDKDPEASKALNVEATRSLAKLCADRSVLLIYISTELRLSGRRARRLTRPTRRLGPQPEGRQGGPRRRARVPVLYGQADTPAESATNVLLDTLWKSQEGAKVKMDHWSIRYPTNTEDVGRVAHGREQDPPRRAALTTNVQPADVAVKYLDTEDTSALPRILQFSSEDKMTKYEIVQTFADIMGLSMENVEPNTEGNDPNASVQRPYDCHLSTKALQDLGIEVWTNDFVGWWRREVHAFRH